MQCKVTFLKSRLIYCKTNAERDLVDSAGMADSMIFFFFWLGFNSFFEGYAVLVSAVTLNILLVFYIHLISLKFKACISF